MNSLMSWMGDKFAPKVNRLAKNDWIASIQDGILAAIPMVLIGSFASVLNIIRNYWKAFPDLTVINTFSFGLFSVFLAYLIPESLLKKKGHEDVSRQAGMGGLAFFFMLVYPSLPKSGNIIFNLSSFGSGGMIAALLAGLFVAFVVNLSTKHSPIGEDSSLPDFIAAWFNTLIPITAVLLVGWLFTFQLHFNLYKAIQSLFIPLINVGQNFWAFLLIYFLAMAFLYSFGISNWVFYPIMTTIALTGIAQNSANYAAGKAVTNIFVNEAADLFLIGGGGATLTLCIMLAFLAKSKRLKMIGRAAIIPSIFNINEPVVFGAPIAFNPLLMVPMWINGFIGPVLTWIVMRLGMVPIPHEVFGVWYTPAPLYGWLATQSWKGALFQVVLFIISWLVYYPFFKMYDKQALEQDKQMAEEDEEDEEEESSESVANA
ncbi:PTS cellobiose transporter subunit IIC [Companilactobacillus farciminis KCTC 3681 = DSM 20184]|nr:PTS cellobiose transporter subunit IIC [Companilactobacillus farciminis KCTC 3681 = DSM 20184]